MSRSPKAALPRYRSDYTHASDSHDNLAPTDAAFLQKPRRAPSVVGGFYMKLLAERLDMK